MALRYSIFVIALGLSSPTLAESIASGTHLGCRERSVWDQMRKRASEGDKVIFQNEVIKRIENGECLYFKAGAEVSVMRRQVVRRLVRIRLKGETTEYWTFASSIKR